MTMRLRLKDVRTGRGLTIDQLADMSGLSRGMLSLLENDKRKPSARTLQQLADALKIKVADLIEDGADAGAGEVLDRWPSLSPDDRERVLTMVRAWSKPSE